jgi:hypothetical protein
MVRFNSWIIGHYLQKRNAPMTKSPTPTEVPRPTAVGTVTRRAGLGEELVNA